MNDANTSMVHPFERAGLGLAPFRYTGHTVEKFQAAPGEPVKPGASCDYCAQAIMDCYWIKSADGRSFKVGRDCVARTTEKGARLLSDVEKAARKAERSKRHARENAKAYELAALLARPEVRAALAAHPHPHAFRASLGETLLDSIEFALTRSGASGRVRILSTIRKVIADA